MRIPLSGFYQLHDACRALSDKTKDVYPEELLRLVQGGYLRPYMILDEEDIDAISDIDEQKRLMSELEKLSPFYHSQSSNPDDEPDPVESLYFTFSIERETLRYAISFYADYRSDHPPTLGSTDYDQTLWYPRRVSLFSSGKELTLVGDNLKPFGMNFHDIHFRGEELNALCNFPTPEPIKSEKKRSSSPLDPPLRYPYVDLLRQLVQIHVGDIPKKSITETYLAEILTKHSEWHTRHPTLPIARTVQTWTDHLIKWNQPNKRHVLQTRGKFTNHIWYLTCSVINDFDIDRNKHSFVDKLIEQGVETPRDQLVPLYRDL